MVTNTFEITVHARPFALCRIGASDPVPLWALEGTGLGAIVRTGLETSIVCEESLVAEGVTSARGWRALEVQGPIPLDVVGVMAKLSSALADHDISLFAVSTFSTDYLLVQGKDLGRAVRALRHEGHVVHTPEMPL